MILSVRGRTPLIGAGTYLASGPEGERACSLIGDVTLGRDCSIWFGAVLRADVGPITIGDETNVQDGTVIHGTYQKAFAVLGNRVTVGHSAVLHGCKINDSCLIGMGSILMDDCEIASRCMVGAGSLVTEGSKFKEEGWLILGRPAKAVRRLKKEELAFLDISANNYLEYKKWYQGIPSAK